MYLLVCIIVLEAVTGYRECPRFWHRQVPIASRARESICYCVAVMQTGYPGVFDLFSTLLDPSVLCHLRAAPGRGH